MKRYVLTFTLIVAMLAVLLHPYQSDALTELQKIDRDLAKIRKDMEEANALKRKSEKTIKDNKAKTEQIENQKKDTAKTIEQLFAQIDKVGDKLVTISDKIQTTENHLRDLGTQLQDAEDRIKSRDKLLKSRVKLMYTNGFVSYIEVLLSATSFTDFLDRYDALKSIVSQDKDILEDNRKDKEELIVKKKEKDQLLAQVKKDYAQMDQHKQELLAKESEKEELVKVLSSKQQQLHQENEALEEISEEQEKLVLALTKKLSELQNKKKKIDYYKGGKLARPVASGYRITSKFGYRTDPVTGKKGAMHRGVDFGAPKGTTIVAAESGVVIRAQFVSGYGNCVIIDHGNGLQTLYGHIRPNGIKVKEGQTVKRGQKIAEVGNTGKSTGYHLHFGVIKNNDFVNPLPYLK